MQPPARNCTLQCDGRAAAAAVTAAAAACRDQLCRICWPAECVKHCLPEHRVVCQGRGGVETCKACNDTGQLMCTVDGSTAHCPLRADSEMKWHHSSPAKQQ